jgi:hypothetical protein
MQTDNHRIMPAGNSIYPGGEVSCFKNSFAGHENSVFQIRFCGKSPALQVIAQRYKQYSILSLFAFLAFLAISTSSCRKDDNGGKLIFTFVHRVGDADLIKDSMAYTNTAGNKYEVNELQYFISDVILWKEGSGHYLTSDSGVHYVDIDINSTLQWMPRQVFPAGSYDSVSFTIGLNETRNIQGYFVNPPERDMFWPDVMGGGYHYLKMNGKWMTSSSEIKPFNLHLGVGMVSDSLGNDVFIPNYFTVTLPLTACEIHETQLYRQFMIVMDVNSWFDTPNTWDWNLVGGQIMQNQDAMHAAAQNGKNAFSVLYDAPKPK